MKKYAICIDFCSDTCLILNYTSMRRTTATYFRDFRENFESSFAIKIKIDGNFRNLLDSCHIFEYDELPTFEEFKAQHEEMFV